jgi:hypothetical protein
MRWLWVAVAATLAACGSPGTTSEAQAQKGVGSVSGRVVDEDGKPMAGVNIYVDYKTYTKGESHGATLKGKTVTGADGRYRLSMANLPPGMYKATAYQTVREGGRSSNVELSAETEELFGSHQTVVRNFTGGYRAGVGEEDYGNGGILILQNDILDSTDYRGAIVTLESLKTGRKYVKEVRRTGSGWIVDGIPPIGQYRVSVVLDGQQLRVKPFNTQDAFGSSLVGDFNESSLHDWRVVAAP